MRGFDRNEFIEVVGKTASLTEEISELAEKLYKDGFSNLFLIGAGGTYCQFEPYEYMLRGITSIPVYCEIAAEFMAPALDYEFLIFREDFMLWHPDLAIQRRLFSWRSLLKREETIRSLQSFRRRIHRSESLPIIRLILEIEQHIV